jgi:hypothetical protein
MPVACARALCLPRRGHGLDECEDAAAADPARGRFAIADGAAESFQGGLWARLLVEAFVGGEEPSIDWPAWLPGVQARWREQAGAAAGAPWYVEVRQRQGAFATFLGLALDGPAWRAQAVGDACLFQVRAGHLLCAFPLAHSGEFGSTPWLVGARTSPSEVPDKHGLRRQGECRPGDRLWLMTDAVAHWFLAEAEAGGTPWRALEDRLRAPDPDADFAAWVDRLRDTGRLRDDDVTVLAVYL